MSRKVSSFDASELQDDDRTRADCSSFIRIGAADIVLADDNFVSASFTGPRRRKLRNVELILLLPSFFPFLRLPLLEPSRREEESS